MGMWPLLMTLNCSKALVASHWPLSPKVMVLFPESLLMFISIYIYIYIYSLPNTVNQFNGGHWVLQDVSSPQQWEN